MKLTLTRYFLILLAGLAAYELASFIAFRIVGEPDGPPLEERCS